MPSKNKKNLSTNNIVIGTKVQLWDYANEQPIINKFGIVIGLDHELFMVKWPDIPSALCHSFKDIKAVIEPNELMKNIV